MSVEKLIFEKGAPGRRAATMTAMDVPTESLESMIPADMLRKAAGIPKGSGVPHKQKVGKITAAQIREIANTKLKDLNAYDVAAAVKMIEGTARSMGIDVVG